MQAIGGLRSNGFTDDQISILTLADGRVEESGEAMREEDLELTTNTVKRTVEGGIAGIRRRCDRLGIPGVGPWAATSGGAAAGATAGGIIQGIREFWDKRYEAAVKEGKVLVGVHSTDPERMELAAGLLEEQDVKRLDRFQPGEG